MLESIQYLEENTSDWSTILSKWSETHSFRMRELKSDISTFDYIKKFPGLHGKRGIELMSIDLRSLYPSSKNVENWLTLYPNVINRARTLRDNQVVRLLGAIDESLDQRKDIYCTMINMQRKKYLFTGYTAQLSLMLIPYILPHSGKRSEYKYGIATKSEIQNRFIREYEVKN